MANIEKYKEAARKFEQKEQWAKAIDPLLKAIEEFEKSPENDADLALYNRVGDLYVKLNDTTNAVQYYDRAVDRYTDASLVNNAIALCNKVLRLSPGRVASYLKLGILFAKKGFMAEAKQNLLEYADRMQKAGQLEEAFRALKKFAEMTPGQDEVWAMLAQQARSAAKTPEQKEQVDKLLSEFEAKDKAHQQRRSRMSRSMVTGEEIPDEPAPKKGELIFLDIDDVPTPGRKSGATRAPMAAVPPPPPPPPPLVEEEPAPAPEIPPLDLEPTAADELPPIELEPTSLGLEPTSLGLEPTALDAGAPLDLEPTSLGIEPTSLDLEPTSYGAEPVAPEPAASAPEPDFGTIELEPEAPAADLPLLDTGVEGPGTELPLMDLGAAEPAADLPFLEQAPEPAVELPLIETEPSPAAELLPLESEPAATELPLLDSGLDLESAPAAAAVEPEAPVVEFEDLGDVEAPTAATVAELEQRLAVNPSDWDTHRLLGEALLAEGQRERGLAALDACLDGYDQSEQLDAAVSVVEELLRLDPNSIRHQQKRVELAYRSNDRARLVDAYVELADALLRSNQAEMAVAVYQRVLEHDPGNVRAQSAIETLAPPEAATPEPAPRSSIAAPAAPAADAGDYVDLGALLLDDEGPKDTRMRIEDEEPTGDEQKDFQQMLAAFKKGIEANVEDTDFQSHYDLGVAYKEMGLLDEAIAEFQKALRSTDGRLKSSEALGLCFFEKGQFAVAETILKRGLDLPAASDAERVGLLYWLGRAQEEQGKNGDALAVYNRVFAVDINFQDVNQRVRALARAGA